MWAPHRLWISLKIQFFSPNPSIQEKQTLVRRVEGGDEGPRRARLPQLERGVGAGADEPVVGRVEGDGPDGVRVAAQRVGQCARVVRLVGVRRGGRRAGQRPAAHRAVQAARERQVARWWQAHAEHRAAGQENAFKLHYTVKIPCNSLICATPPPHKLFMETR